MTHTILALGDISGRIGRQAIKKILPELRDKYSPTLVIANAENLAHGKGITTKTVEEMFDAGIDIMTSGNHVFDCKAGVEVFEDTSLREKIIRPLNYPPGVTGKGSTIFETPAGKFLIVNLNGRVFIRENFDCPFRTIDNLLGEYKNEKFEAIIVDFHAEATSEKICLGLYLDGRVDALFGTHTHVPTADAKALPKGTLYCTDIGMVGAVNSSLGIDPKNLIDNFLHQTPVVHEVPTEGPCEVDGVIIRLNKAKKEESSIEQFSEIVEI